MVCKMALLASFVVVDLLQVRHFAMADLNQKPQKANELLFQLFRIKKLEVLKIRLNKLPLLQTLKKDLHLSINTIVIHHDFN